MGKTRSRPAGFWCLAVMLLAGLLSQACSDNKGPSGPTFGAGQTGTADTSEQIRVQVAVNPGSIELGRRAGVTVLVTNLNGRPLQGRAVQLSTTVGKLDRVDGFTDAAGKFITFLLITPQDAANAAGLTSATVTAFVEGATAEADVNFAQTLPAPPAAPLSIIPAAASVGDIPSVAARCAVSFQFRIAGGVPPYTAVASNRNASVSGNGRYTATVPVGTISDTITVRDSAGAQVTATLTGTCLGP
jgi:hypothetical protein